MKSVYLETMGCQMNVLDSELVMGQLRRLGYAPTGDMLKADVVLLNTCSVRDHAEQKALSRLGALKKPKAARNNLVVGVIGCMAERDPDGIFSKMPHVDLVCGPGELNKVPALIEEVLTNRERAIALAQSLSRRSTPVQRALEFDSVEALDLSREPDPQERVLQAYIRVQRGCDKFCTFCVVPFTRGPERSRPPKQIVEEAKMLADRGAREVTLLGQTVNSYVNQEESRPVRFAELLSRVAAVDGIDRVRFVTSYPGDWDEEIFQVMRDEPKIARYLHIPAQSGSNAVLKRMRRVYTAESYIELMDKARSYLPDLAIASDFIVGFCGETEEDHQKTVELMKRCRFHRVFVFKYSPRPNTVADKREPDDIPDAVKRRRNHELLQVQESMSLEANRAMVGRNVDVLVEGFSKAALKAQQAEQTRGEEVTWRRSDQLVGRTIRDEIVVFNGSPEDIGRITGVTIEAATALTLHGSLTAPSGIANPLRPAGANGNVDTSARASQTPDRDAATGSHNAATPVDHGESGDGGSISLPIIG